ncbi:MAG: Lrp/AsnC family transcriptional regulator [Betaproteobacteria bacterium]
MDAIDRLIVNLMQSGFPITEAPYREAAALMGIGEDDMIQRLARMLESGVLTRFGPLFQIERIGGLFTLAAMSVPGAEFERVAGVVNAMPEVAHNYEREHELNMWFVIAAESPQDARDVISRIEREAGYEVIDLPKLREYFVGLRLEV